MPCSLRKLTDEHGISILYITHDLATAYQVSDAILVLYRAHLAEAGAIEPVVRRPQHPSTPRAPARPPIAAARRPSASPPPPPRGRPPGTRSCAGRSTPIHS